MLRNFNDYRPAEPAPAPEEWRRIPGIPNYLASDLGRVMSLCGREVRILRPGLSTRGYRQVVLHGRTHAVHRLVCRAFHGEPQHGQEVRHLDGDKLNNSALNVAWGTSAENARDTIRMGRHNQVRKAECPAGHAYAVHGYRDRSGRRRCARCEADRSAARRRAAAEALVFEAPKTGVSGRPGAEARR